MADLLECQGCHQLEYSEADKPCSLCGCGKRAKPIKKVWRYRYAKEVKSKVKK